MKSYKKIKIIGSLLVMITLTGCSSSSNALMMYKKTVPSASDYIISSNADDEYATLKSEEVCVVPVKKDKGGDGNLTSEATLLVNNTDNNLLYADHIYEKLYPASITKVMTALLAIEEGNLEDTVTVSHDAANITEPGASLCGIKEGDQINLKDLITMFLMSSGNDAGVAIAEHIAGSVPEFSKIMNKKAKELGATHTHFVNPHGLHDDNHYTTAYDIYLMFKEALTLDTFVEIISKDSFEATYKNSNGDTVVKPFSTTNLYLKGNEAMPEGVTVIGGKTGTTNLAGSCLVLYSKDKSDKDYISVILKANNKASLYSQMSYLLKFINK